MLEIYNVLESIVILSNIDISWSDILVIPEPLPVFLTFNVLFVYTFIFSIVLLFYFNKIKECIA